MKAIGGLLLVFGIIGLLVTLIFWLPTGMSLPIVLFICVACMVAVWGGGKLASAAAGAGEKQAKGHVPMAKQSYQIRCKITCPKCGGLVMPGQRFCGDCGVSLVSFCPSCGAAIISLSKFCGYCGTRLI